MIKMNHSRLQYTFYCILFVFYCSLSDYCEFGTLFCQPTFFKKTSRFCDMNIFCQLGLVKLKIDLKIFAIVQE